MNNSQFRNAAWGLVDLMNRGNYTNAEINKYIEQQITSSINPYNTIVFNDRFCVATTKAIRAVYDLGLLESKHIYDKRETKYDGALVAELRKNNIPFTLR